MSAEQQNDLVAQYILDNCSDEIGDEGAGDVAVRLLDKYRVALRAILWELKGPAIGPGNTCEAQDIAEKALTPYDRPEPGFPDELVDPA